MANMKIISMVAAARKRTQAAAAADLEALARQVRTTDQQRRQEIEDLQDRVEELER